MPNWCENDVYVATDNLNKSQEQLAGFLKVMYRKEINGYDEQVKVFNLQELVPLPTELQRRVKKAGHTKSAHNWRVKTWGTKWEPEIHSLDNDKNWLTMSFDSAWSPPLGAIVWMSKDFPLLQFSIEYKEPGMCFQGRMVVKAGKVLEKEEGDYQDDFDEELQKAVG